MAVIRPEFGPTLPSTLRERFGVPPMVTLLVAFAVAAAAVVAILLALTRPEVWGERVIRKGPPVFNMIYPGGTMHVTDPGSGELVRLEGRSGGLESSVVVRPLELPDFDGDVTHGLLPVYADRFVESQKRAMPGVELVQEGRARVNNAVGYEVGYQRITSSDRFTGRDVLLVPDDPEVARGPVVISLRQRKASGAKLTAPERKLSYFTRKTYRSFRYGTDRG